MQDKGLLQIYVMFGCVADNASPEVFKRIPQSELKCLAKHVKDVFLPLVSDRCWTSTGVLQNYDQELLECMICFAKHSSFVMVATDADYDLLGLLSQLCAARRGTKFPALVLQKRFSRLSAMLE